MRIGEIAERTGLNISNIRFYERKGLIGPDREKDSKYRNYTEEDLKRIQQIILYRKMDISVETIGQILDGEMTLQSALESQILELQEKKQMIQGSIDLCQKVMEDGTSENLDIDYYLSYVSDEESKGSKFGDIDELIEDFATITQFDRLVGSSYWGWLLINNTRFGKIVMTIWCLFFLAVPIIGIIDDLYNGVSPIRMTFWIMWLILYVASFIYYRQYRKKGVVI